MINNQTIQHRAAALREFLADPARTYASVLPKEILGSRPFIFDFSDANKKLARIDLRDTAAFTAYTDSEMARAGARLGIGRYGEDRAVYRASSLFTGNGEPRSVHLAIDLWTPVGTAVFSPLPARVHSFQVNDHFLDYGATIILEHNVGDATFYTLYGHLSRSSLDGLSAGQPIEQAAQIATVGEKTENGQWPPHLHFQMITDMLGNSGDFPGVARASEKEYYLALCPDPNLILRLETLAQR